MGDNILIDCQELDDQGTSEGANRGNLIPRKYKVKLFRHVELQIAGNLMKFTQLIDSTKQRVAGKWTGIEQMLRVPASMCHKQVAGVTKLSNEELYKAV